MRPSRHFLVLAATMALLLLTSVAGRPQLALADDAKPDYAAAKKHYVAAEEAAQAKDWGKAAAEFSIAYDITRDPVLFFKLGNAYQLSGDCTRAVEYFERYIAEANPSEEYKSDTQARISACSSAGTSGTEGTETPPPIEPDKNAGNKVPGLEENSGNGAVDMELQAGDGEQVGQPTFLDDKPSWQETAAWTSVGVSFAFLSASAILGLSANSREEDIENLFRFRDSSGNPAEYDTNIQKRLDSLIDEGEDLNTLSMVALGLAGVSTASAILFFVLDSSASKEAEGLNSIAPIIGDDSMGVAANWAF